MKHKKSLSPVFSATLFEAAAAGAKTCAAIAGRFWLCVPFGARVSSSFSCYE